MSDLGCFNTSSIRVVTLEGNPWFVAKDVYEALELGWDKANNVYAPSRLVKPLHDDEKASKQIATSGQKVILVSESGLYKLIMRSDKPQSKAFQDWVTKEVLPSIRKTGAYGHQQEAQPRRLALCATETKRKLSRRPMA